VKLDQEYEVVAVGKLKEHPQNPRRGDVAVIDESIEVNGWYGAVIAQKSTGFILAGNHRFRVAKSRGAKEVPVIWRDVDDDAAVRILLADNRTADAGTYDEELLGELLSGLETLDGTGFDLGAVEAAEESREGENGAGEVPDDGADIPDDKYVPSYAVMVVCKDEAEQEKIYKKLDKLGLELRVVAV
jgi:ParB-like chromosome segregation protein Spo0J